MADDFDILLNDATEVETVDFAKCAVVPERFPSSAAAQEAEAQYFAGRLDRSPSFPMRFYNGDNTLERLHRKDVECLIQDFGIEEWEFNELFKIAPNTGVQNG